MARLYKPPDLTLLARLRRRTTSRPPQCIHYSTILDHLIQHIIVRQLMMQRRRREHDGSSSGELDVFGATSYFAGLSPPAAPDDDDCPSRATEPSADRLFFQAMVVQRDTARTMAMEGNSFRGPHQHQQQPGVHDHTNNKQLQVVATKRQPSASGKSKLAALLSFMASPSPSPRASFRKENKQQQQQQALAAAASATGGEKLETASYTYKANPRSSSSRESSMPQLQLQGLFGGAHDDDDEEELDLGVATGDRRLQGITVVRRGGDEERWVVRCVVPGGAWDDEEHREKMLDVDAAAESASASEQNTKDELVEVEQLQGDGDDGNIDPDDHSWDSDSSSDLFDLDLEYR